MNYSYVISTPAGADTIFGGTKSGPGLALLNLGLAALYFVAAYLSLSIAIPPGYATAMWPAAGIALAALLLYGYRLWPGVLAGSVLVNLVHAYNPESGAGLIQLLPVTASVGIGAALQGVAAAWLIRRKVDLDSGLVDTRDILVLLLLGGPIGCLISASWGVSTLYLAGIVETENLLYNWVTWWAGDSVGVLFMLPLVFIWIAEPREFWETRKIGVALPLIIAVTIVTLVFLIQTREHEKQIEFEFNQQAQLLGDTLKEQMRRNFEVIYSLQGLFETAEFVDRSEYRRFLRRAMERNPGISALSWNPVVAHSRRATFEQSMRAQGFTDFSFNEHDDAGRPGPAQARDYYVITHYVEPLQENDAALGFDAFSNEALRTALRIAHATGELTASAPTDLLSRAGRQLGVLLFLPVYSYPQGSQLEAAGADLPRGYIIGSFVIDDLLTQIIVGNTVDELLIRLTDVDDASSPRPLASHLVRHGRLFEQTLESDSIDAGLYWGETFDVGNRSWRIDIGITPGYLSSRHLWQLWGIFITGLMFAVGLGTFLLILSGRAIADQGRVDALAIEVAEREAIELQLHLANDRLERIARTDELTQIYNRRAIEEIGTRLEAEAKRYASQYSVLLLDIDRFKSVNDQWGHKAGDAVLKGFSDCIRAALRDVDEFGRWGGEEFMVLANNTPLRDAVDLAERLCGIIAARELPPAGVITTSIGVATSHEDERFEDVVLRADRALYLAKDRGRDRVEVDERVEMDRQAGS